MADKPSQGDRTRKDPGAAKTAPPKDGAPEPKKPAAAAPVKGKAPARGKTAPRGKAPGKGKAPAKAPAAAPPAPTLPESLPQAGTPEEIARIARRWALARERDARNKERAEVWKRRMSRVKNAIARPWNWVESRLEAVGRVLSTPFRAVWDQLEDWRNKREELRLERLKATEAEREAKARLKWEKKKEKDVVRREKMASFKIRFAVVITVLGAPGRAFSRFQKRTGDMFAAPYRAILLRREEAAERRMLKKKAKLDKTADAREQKIRKRHERLMRKEMRKRMKRERWRRRMAGVGRAWRRFRYIWSQTGQIRKIIYIGVGIYLAYRYRIEIADKIDSVFGFDLQRLLK